MININSLPTLASRQSYSSTVPCVSLTCFASQRKPALMSFSRSMKASDEAWHRVFSTNAVNLLKRSDYIGDTLRISSHSITEIMGHWCVVKEASVIRVRNCSLPLAAYASVKILHPVHSSML